MKQILFYARNMAVALLLMLGTANASAQNSETTMQDIYEKGKGLVELLEETYNMEIVRIEFDLLFDTKETTRGFNSKYEYTVVGFADHRVEDLDITIYRKSGGNWVQVVKDTEADNSPIVQFRPTSGSQYKIEVKAYKFAQGYSAAHYGIIIAHEIPN